MSADVTLTFASSGVSVTRPRCDVIVAEHTVRVYRCNGNFDVYERIADADAIIAGAYLRTEWHS
jgi:hypothetical protein